MTRLPPSDPTLRESPGGGAPCLRPRERSFLLLYMLSGCEEEEALAFEAHILECEACFRDLRCLDRARALIQEFTRQGSPVRDRVRQSVRDERSQVLRGERPGGEGTPPSSRIAGEAPGHE